MNLSLRTWQQLFRSISLPKRRSAQRKGRGSRLFLERLEDRFLPSAPGSLDQIFGTNGVALADIAGNKDIAYAEATDRQGRLVVVGTTNNGTKDNFAIARFNTDGKLDTTFNGTGIVTLSIGNGNDDAQGVAVDSSGRIVVAGFSTTNGNKDFAVARFNTDGTLDKTFNGTGIVTTDFAGHNDQGQGVTIDSSGRIVVGGSASLDGSTNRFAIARYNVDGTLDMTSTVVVGGVDDAGRAVQIDSSGNILLAGEALVGSNYQMAVARFTSSGGVDMGFGSSGIAKTTLGFASASGTALQVDSAGRIFVGGNANTGATQDFAIACFTNNGSGLDSSFGPSGMATVDFGSTQDYAYGLTIDRYGHLIATGYTFNGSSEDLALARFNLTGGLDTTFGTNGKVTANLGGSAEVAYSAVSDASGRITVAGFSNVNGTFDFALARFNGQPTWTVTTTADGPGTVDTVARTSTTLRGAIANASAGDVIEFSPGLTGNIDLTSAGLGTLVLGKNVTIDGDGASVTVEGGPTVGGASNVQVFQVNSGVTAVLNGLTISNGVEVLTGANTDNGAGIDNLGTLTVSHCTFLNNSGSGSYVAGGIYNFGTLNVVASDFEGNSATHTGGAIGSRNGTVTVTDSTFIGNSASGGGGAIFTALNTGLTVTGCTFDSNTAGGGGAIEDQASVAWSIASSVFTNNAATDTAGSGIGGAVEANSNALTVTDSTFTGNSAVSQGGAIFLNQGLISACTLSGNSAGDGGGLFFSGAGPGTVANSTIVNNVATPRHGSGGGIACATAQVTITSSTLVGNSAFSDGGGIYGLALLTNTILAQSGGGDFKGTVDPSSSYNLIDDNSTGLTNGPNGNLIGAGINVGLDPAGLKNNGGPTQTIALLPGSEAIGGGSYSGPGTDQRGASRPTSGPWDIGAYQFTTTSLVVTNTNPTGSPGDGSLTGAVALANQIGGNVTITFDPTVFQTAQVITPASTLDLNDTTGTITIHGPAAGVTVNGGGTKQVFRVESGTRAGIDGLTISGGAALIGAGIDNFGTVFLNNSTLSNNTASGSGGAIFNERNYASVILNRCVITGNAATLGDGGAIYNASTDRVSITQTAMSGNVAGGRGGVIFNMFGGVVDAVIRSQLDNNQALDGGAIWNFSQFFLIDSELSGNIATSNGGAVYNRDNNSPPARGLFASNTSFTNNHAGNDGGAIFNTNAYARLYNSTTLSGNIAGNDAGAIFNAGGSTLSLDSSQVSGNQATNDGGAIYNAGNARLSANQTTLSGNVAGGRGGAVFNMFGGVVDAVTQSQLTDNQAHDGGAIWNFDECIVVNSQLSGNTAIGDGGAIMNRDNNAPGHGLFVYNSQLSSNHAAGDGGAVFNTNAYARLNSGSSLSGNVAANAGGIFNNTNAVLLIDGTTLIDNQATSYAGGIENLGNVTLTNSTVSGNSAQAIGAIYNRYATFTANNSTIANNSATLIAGGLGVVGGTANVSNSTIAGNIGGGIFVSGASALTLTNTIVAANPGADITGPGGIGQVQSSSSFNLIGNGSQLSGISDGSNGNHVGTSASPINPLLGPLANYGGPTETMALSAASPAIHAGIGGGSGTDQRGDPRPTVGAWDIGAYQVQPNNVLAVAVTAGLAGNSAYGSHVVADASGNAYEVGTFTGTIQFDAGHTLTSAGEGDIFIAKYDPAGNLLWVQQIGGPNIDDNPDVTLATISGQVQVLVTGWFQGSTTVGAAVGTPVSLNDPGQSESCFFARLDSSTGTVISAQMLGASGYFVRGLAITADTAGNAYVGGYFTGTAGFGRYTLTNPHTGAVAEAFVVKIDSTNNVVWADGFQALGGTAGFVFALAADAAGNVYAGGRFDGTVDFAGISLTANNAFNPDAFFVKLDGSTGNSVWARSLDASAFAYGSGLAVDRNGNVDIAGEFGGYSSLLNLTSYSNDGYVAQLDANGNLVWARDLGGSGGITDIEHLAIDAAGNVYTTGSFVGTDNFDPSGTYTVSSLGSQDGFVWALNSQGVFQWVRDMGGVSASARGGGIATYGAGNVYVTGYFSGTVNFNAPATFDVTSQGTSDAFLVKYVNLQAGGSTFTDQAGSNAVQTVGYLIDSDPAATPGQFSALVNWGDGTPSDTNAVFVQNPDGTFSVQDSHPYAAAGTYSVTVTITNACGTTVTATGTAVVVNFTLNPSSLPPAQAGTYYTQTLTALGGTAPYSYTLTVPGLPPGISLSPTGVLSGTTTLAGTFSFQVTATDSTSGTPSKVSKNYVLTVQPAAQGSTSLALAYTLGSSGADQGLRVVTDSSGNYYVFGRFQGTVDFDPGPGVTTLTGVSNRDCFLAKYDSMGNFLWVQQFAANAGANANVNGLNIDGSGNLYVTGSFTSQITFGTSGISLSTLVQEGFVTKIDSAGNFLWVTTLGSGANTFSSDIAVDGSGSVYVTGSFSGSGSFGSTNLTSTNSNNDVFIAKLSNSGSVTWAEAFQGPGEDEGYRIAVDAGGNIYLTGSYLSTIDFDPSGNTVSRTATNSNGDGYVVKLDTNGGFQWVQTFNSGSYSGPYAVAVDGSGDAYVGGWFFGNAPGLGLTAIGNQDAVVEKLASDGTIIWVRQFGGAGSDAAVNNLAVDAAGNVFSTGEFDGTIDFDPNSGTYNLAAQSSEQTFVSELDRFGNFVSAVGLSGTSVSRGDGIAVDQINNVYVTGSDDGAGNYNPGSGGAFTLGNAGNADVYVVKLDTGHPVQVLNVSPNLASGTVTAGTTSFTINFNRAAIGGDLASNYKLVSAGPDGLLGTADDIPLPLSVSYNDTTAILTFSGLSAGLFRMTVTGGVTNGDGVAMTPYTADFVTAVNSLAFGQPPANMTEGQVLSPVTVDLLDLSGNPILNDSRSVSVAVASGPAGFTPASTTTVNAVNGVATFANLTLSIPGTYTLTFTLNDVSGRTLQISAPVTITDAAVSASGTPFIAAENQGYSGAIGQVVDGNPFAPLPGTTVSIDWGDGTPLDTTSGSLSGSLGTYTVSGSHTYTEDGSYTVTATLQEPGNSTPIVFQSTALVSLATITANPGTQTTIPGDVDNGGDSNTYILTVPNLGAQMGTVVDITAAAPVGGTLDPKLTLSSVPSVLRVAAVQSPQVLGVPAGGGGLMVVSDNMAYGNTTAHINQFLLPGTYAITVSAGGDQSSTGAYNLSVHFGPASPDPFTALYNTPANPVGLNPIDIVATDFGNGTQDIATLNQGSSDVSVLIGNGDGSFQTQVRYKITDASGNPVQLVRLVTGYYNADARPDLLALDNAGKVYVLRGIGDGTFFAPRELAGGGLSGSIDEVLRLPLSDPSLAAFNTALTSSPLGVNPITMDSLIPTKPLDFNRSGISSSANIDPTTDSVQINLGVTSRVRASVILPDSFSPFGGSVVSFTNPAGTMPIRTAGGPASTPTATPLVLDATSRFPQYVIVVGQDGRILLRPGTYDTAAIQLNAVGTVTRAVTVLSQGDAARIAALNMDGTITIYQRNANSGAWSATFTTPKSQAVASPSPASAIASGLLTAGDANPDIVVPDPILGAVAVYTGNADGSFNAPVYFHTGITVSNVAVQDVNGDGAPDIIVTDSASGAVDVLINQNLAVGPAGQPGSFGYQPTITPDLSGFYTLPPSPLTENQPVPLDLTFFPDLSDPLGFTSLASYRAGTGGASGYGEIDSRVAAIIGAALDRSLGTSTLSGLLDAQFFPYSNDHTSAVTVADLNDDKVPDLVVNNRDNNTFSILFGIPGSNGATGSFVDPVTYALPAGNIGPTQIVIGDFGNGYPDLAILNTDSATISVYLNDGTGTFTPVGQKLNAGYQPTGLSIQKVTVNGQTRTDLVIGNTFGDALHLIGEGNADPRLAGIFEQDPGHPGNKVPFVTQTDAVTGLQDVILVNELQADAATARRIPGQPSFQAPTLFSSASQGLIGPQALTMANLPISPYASAAVANTGANLIEIHAGVGPNLVGGITATYFVGTNPVAVTKADLNGDGIPDLVVANRGSNDISILLGNADGTFTAGPRLSSGGLGPNAVSVGDYNGDGIPDILVTNGQSGNMAMLPGIGSGGKGTGFFNDTAPKILPFPQPIIDTNGRFALMQDGSIFTFDPTNLGGGAQQALGASNVTALAAPIGSSLVVARGDSTLSLLVEDSSGQLNDSLDFRDARLDDPSALQLIGGEIYVTNAGSNDPIVIELSSGIPVALAEGGAGRGQQTGVESAGNEFTLVAVVTTGQTENGTGLLENGIDSSLVAGLGSLLSVPTLGHPLNDAGSGSVEDDDWLAMAKPIEVESSGNAWTDLVFGIWQAVQERHQEAEGELLNYHFDSAPEDLRPTLMAVAPTLEGMAHGVAPVFRESVREMSRAIVSLATEPSSRPASVDGSGIAPERVSSSAKRQAAERTSLRVSEDPEWRSEAPLDLSDLALPRVQMPVARPTAHRDESLHDLAWAGLLAVLLPRRDEEDDHSSRRRTSPATSR